MNEAELLDDVAEALAQRGVAITSAEFARAPRTPGDALIRLEWRGRTREYLAEIKERPSPAFVSVVSALPHNALLLARHVSPTVAAVCRELGVHFADTAGNVFLDWDDVLLDVEGRRADPRATSRPERPLRAFQPSGLRILFALLCRPRLVSAPYREISEAADVSVGSVHVVMKELAENGYVEERQSGRALHRTRELFDRWVEAYALNLEPRLVLGRFDTDDPGPWLTGAADTQAFGGQWGGESAASVLAGHLRPSTAIVYVTALSSEVLRRYRLRRASSHAPVVFRERFWRFDDRWHVVPSLLVYADLVASGDPRQAEAARDLRERDDDLRRLDAR